MTEPKIRFKRDDGRAFPDWEQVPFGDVIEQYSERTKTENEDTLLSCAIEGIYLNSELFGHQRGSSTIGYKKIDKGTLILSAQNLHLGNANVNLRFEHGMISPAYNTYHIKGCDVNFMAQWIKREATKKFFFDATTTGASECRRNVMWDELYKQKMGVPSLPEQQKIADFLSNVDEVIAASEEEVANLEQQKKAVIQKIFSQEVRFKREDGSDFPDWERMSMSDIFKEIIDKNHPEMPVLSILQGVGTVLRDESDRNILYDKSNLKGYKAMKKDDFIIHLRTFEGGLECSNHDGISSPAYKILRTDKLVPTAYRAYFRSHDFIERKLSVAVTGIRDGKNIDMPTFWEIQMDIPSIPEQQKIADFLTSYDEAITAAKQELAKWKELKKGLLQQMFV